MMYAYWIPAFPLAAFAAILFFGRQLGKRSAWVAIGGSLLSALFSLRAASEVIGGTVFQNSFVWIRMGTMQIFGGILIDPLCAMMLFVVTTVGTLIFIYSVGYMKGDARFSRYFAYLSLFMSSMLGLVLSNNYLQLYIFWELVGLCSYLLIGFWFEKPSAAAAGKKAFLTTRFGDIGLFIGILLLFYTTGTLLFTDFTPEFLRNLQGQAALLTLSCVLIFFGACGKSAQFPLHVWLPDAMEGPTAVSALIHAATMVAAGVYLVARSFLIFSAFSGSLKFVSAIGVITAFMAAAIALTAVDIKKVLAYSTISQLGYMMAALGLGGYAAGTFHLMTHAFFKALLFLGAGSVIHAVHTQDLRSMGGLLSKMKITGLTFLVGSLAIAGVWPLSGFFSKDEILLAAYHAESKIYFWVLWITAFLTAFYMFRLFFLAFLGKPRGDAHAHESAPVMTVPLIVLAFFAAFSGWPGSPYAHHWFQGFIQGGHHHAAPHASTFVVLCSVAAGLGGIALAYVMYIAFPRLPEKLSRALKPFYLLSVHKFWVDEFYEKALLDPSKKLARFLYTFDQRVVDGAVNGAGRATLWMSAVKDWIDRTIVDGVVNGAGRVVAAASRLVRRIQTGMVQNYIFVMVLGLLCVIAFETFR